MVLRDTALATQQACIRAENTYDAIHVLLPIVGILLGAALLFFGGLGYLNFLVKNQKNKSRPLPRWVNAAVGIALLSFILSGVLISTRFTIGPTVDSFFPPEP